jgi:hypothetical protein
MSVLYPYPPTKKVIHRHTTTRPPPPSRTPDEIERRGKLIEPFREYVPLEKREIPMPNTRHLLRQLHEDLKKSYASVSKGGRMLHLTPRRFEVWWRGEKGSLVDPIQTGWIEFNEDILYMETLKTLEKVATDGGVVGPEKIVYGVDIGLVDGFPLAGSTVYYIPQSDMLYLFPVEGYRGKETKRPRFVYPWYTFTDILRSDSGSTEKGRSTNCTIRRINSSPAPRFLNPAETISWLDTHTTSDESARSN